MFLDGINYRRGSRKSFVAPQLFGRLTILERDGSHQNPDRCCATGQKSVEPTNPWAPNSPDVMHPGVVQFVFVRPKPIAGR